MTFPAPLEYRIVSFSTTHSFVHIVPHEFAGDEPFLGHPETRGVWVTRSRYSARATSCVFRHLRRKTCWGQNFIILSRRKDLHFKIPRHMHQIVKFGRKIKKLLCAIETGPRKKGELVQVHFQHWRTQHSFLSRQQYFSAALRIFIPEAKSQEIVHRFGSYIRVCRYIVKFCARFVHEMKQPSQKQSCVCALEWAIRKLGHGSPTEVLFCEMFHIRGCMHVFAPASETCVRICKTSRHIVSILNCIADRRACRYRNRK